MIKPYTLKFVSVNKYCLCVKLVVCSMASTIPLQVQSKSSVVMHALACEPLYKFLGEAIVVSLQNKQSRPIIVT